MVVLTTFSPPTEGIKHEQSSTKLIMDGREVGTGTLYIAESTLAWKNNSTGEGFSLLYPHIAIHAVSRDINHFGNECLFIMVDTCLDDNEVNEEDNEEEASGMTEMRFVPDDKEQLDAMFLAMSHCQSQHPPDEVLSEDEYVDADEDGEEYIEGDGDTYAINDHSQRERSSNGHMQEEMETDGQFLDAEDEQ